METLKKLVITMAAVVVILVMLVALPLLIGLGSFLLPILAVIGIIIFIPVGIGVLIGSTGKKGGNDGFT